MGVHINKWGRNHVLQYPLKLGHKSKANLNQIKYSRNVFGCNPTHKNFSELVENILANILYVLPLSSTMSVLPWTEFRQV